MLRVICKLRRSGDAQARDGRRGGVQSTRSTQGDLPHGSPLPVGGLVVPDADSRQTDVLTLTAPNERGVHGVGGRSTEGVPTSTSTHNTSFVTGGAFDVQESAPRRRIRSH